MVFPRQPYSLANLVHTSLWENASRLAYFRPMACLRWRRTRAGIRQNLMVLHAVEKRKKPRLIRSDTALASVFCAGRDAGTERNVVLSVQSRTLVLWSVANLDYW